MDEEGKFYKRPIFEPQTYGLGTITVDVPQSGDSPLSDFEEFALGLSNGEPRLCGKLNGIWVDLSQDPAFARVAISLLYNNFAAATRMDEHDEEIIRRMRHFHSLMLSRDKKIPMETSYRLVLKSYLKAMPRILDMDILLGIIGMIGGNDTILTVDRFLAQHGPRLEESWWFDNQLCDWAQRIHYVKHPLS